MLLANSADGTVANELALLLIPKPEGKGFEAGEQCDGFDGLKKGLRFVTFFKVIVWSTSNAFTSGFSKRVF